MNKNKKEIPVITVSDKEFKALKGNLENNNLSETEKKITLTILEAYRWLADLHRLKKLSIQKVMRLFGHKSERQKRAANKKDENDKNPPGTGRGKKKRGHGKRGKNDFPGAKRELHRLEELKTGDNCPECPLGRLYPVNPGSYVHFEGRAPLDVVIHETEKLRCNACGSYFEADLEEGLKEKYGKSADVAIAVQKYALGLPFYRMSKWQGYLGVPLSASVQWERCESLMNSVYPVYLELLKLASDVWMLHGDDTGGRILDVERGRKKKVWTTGIVGHTKRGIANLFFTGEKYCGQNVDDLLRDRKDESVAIIVSDALSWNVPKEAKFLWGNCNTHARRNFWDYRKEYPDFVRDVLHRFGKVYKNEGICVERGYSADERLRYHQKHSSRVIEGLRKWCLLQIHLKKIEPNEELGKAIKYFLRHYEKLTLFLRVPGVPLDNNVVERLLKTAILNRKNSYFYKTQFGALVGDVMMSLIETCKRAGKKPV